MDESPRSLFGRFHTLALLVIFIAALGIRLYDLTDLPLDFHPTRQLFSALKARGMYYETLPNAPAEQRELKHRVGRIESLFWQDEAWRLFPQSRRAAWRTLLKSIACSPGNGAAWRLGLYFGLPDRFIGLLRRCGWW